MGGERERRREKSGRRERKEGKRNMKEGMGRVYGSGKEIEKGSN